MIPRRLIRCVPAETSDEVEEWWRAWQELHPGYEAITYRDPLNPALFPLTGHLFASAVSGAQLASIVRLEAVYTLGGVYLDSDIEPLRPIGDLLYHPAFACREDDEFVCDAVIGAEPRHPGIRAAIDCARAGDLPAGPANLTRALRDRSDVTLLARRLFFPYHYTERDRRGEDFAHTSPESYAVHHWAFSWSPKGG